MARQVINSNAVEPLGLPNTGTGVDLGDTWNTAVTKLNAMTTDLYAGGGSQLTNTAISNSVLPSGAITGANTVVLNSTAPTPGTLTTRTAAQMLTDAGANVGNSYWLRIINAGTSILTLAPGAGVSMAGTMTVAASTWRDFIVTFNSATSMTIQSIGTGTYS